MNEVVREDGGYRGQWGRGATLDEALKNAGLKQSDSYTHYSFTKDEVWDIDNTGLVSWEQGGLKQLTRYRKGVAQEKQD